MPQTLAQKIAAQKAAIAQAQSAIEDIQNPPKYPLPAGVNPVLDYMKAERIAAASEEARAAVLAQAERSLATAQAALPPMEKELIERQARLSKNIGKLQAAARSAESARLEHLKAIDSLSRLRSEMAAELAEDQLALIGKATDGLRLDRNLWTALNASLVVSVLETGAIFAEVRSPGFSFEGKLNEQVKVSA